MKFKRQQAQQADFQLAPMVDILFILLIFFILTYTFQALEKELSIALPDASSSEQVEQSGRDIIINVSKTGEFIVNRRRYSLSELKDLLVRTQEIIGTRAVLIRADRGAIYEHIVHVMDTCAELGIKKISFITQDADNS